MVSTARSTRHLSDEINTASGRLGLLASAAITLGPALAPLGAVSVQAVGGLANQMAFAALTAGVAATAFIGMGDAVKAVMEASSDPSIDNLIKASEELSRLGPEAQSVIAQLGLMRDEFGALRTAAQRGMFPGVIDGLEEIERLLPRLEGLFETVGQAAGGAFADAAESLGSERWAGFLEFLEREAPATIRETATALGALTHGLAEMWMAFDPLNDSFSVWMINASRGFDRWASNLSKTDGFRDFVEFVQESGPQASDALGALVNALVQVTQAISPLGGPVLGALETVFDLIAGIAESPAGPRLFTMAAAVIALNRALAAGTALMGRFGAVTATAAGGTGTAGAAGAAGAGGFAAFRQRIDGARTSVGAFRRDLTTVTTSMMTAGAASQREAQRTAAAMSNLRTTAAATGRVVGGASAGVAAFAVASGSVGSSLDIQNTAMLGLVGSMKGPWGAAIGASVGLLIDMQKAGKDAESAMSRLNATMASAASAQGLVNPTNYATAAAQALADVDAIWNRANQFGGVNPTAWGLVMDRIQAGGNQSQTPFGQAEGDAFAAEAFADRYRIAIGALGQAMGVARDNASDFDAILAQVTPALLDMGITAEDLANAVADDSIWTWRDEILAWDDAINQAKYSVTAFGDSLSHLNDMLEGRASIRDYEAALDGVTESIAEHGRTLDIDTAAGRANAEALDKIAETSLAVADGLQGAERTTFLTRAREDMIAAAQQFGMTEDAASAFASSVGLSFDLIQQSSDATAGELSQLIAEFRKLPSEVITDIETNGYPQTVSEVSALQRKYDLTPGQVNTILRARDEVTPVLARVRSAIAGVTRNVTVRVQGILSGFGFGSSSAMGNLFASGHPAVAAYANGGMDVPNGHQPEITRPGGPVRIWAEPETQGEAYIPLANDGRRPRAIDIWQQAGRELGVYHFARGGVSAAERRQTVLGAINSFAPEYRADNMDPRMKALRDDINTLRLTMKSAGVGFSVEATRAAGAMQKTAARLFTLQDSVDGLREAQKNLMSQTIGNFRNDLWGNGVAGARLQLEADINDARTARNAQAQLGKLGVSAGLLEGLYASGDIGSMTQLAGMSKAEIAELNKLYATRQSVSSAVGANAAQQVYGAQIAKLDKQIAQQTYALSKYEKAIENAAYRGYVAGAKAVAAGTNARRK
ncbi:hypothetical protein [Nocardioides zeae]